MAKLPSSIKELCTPAAFYFIISIIGFILIAIQNINSRGIYVIGNYSCPTTSLTLIFFYKLIYILFWTYILNLICRDGRQGLSWLLVLLPYILLFVIIGLLMLM